MNQYLNTIGHLLFGAFSFTQTTIEDSSSKTWQEADAKAIASDWLVVGKDIMGAIKGEKP